jgi:hypothetical protein
MSFRGEMSPPEEKKGPLQERSIRLLRKKSMREEVSSPEEKIVH